MRTLQIEGKPYFVGKDVAEKLGYSNPTKAVSTHCKGVSKMGIPSTGGIQQMSVIPESDLYRLIIKSKLPEAEKFEAWVMEEVLPTANIVKMMIFLKVQIALLNLEIRMS
ncbi:MAG: BRO-N domain-containing protein [Clostridium sp.]|uniref:BRO-N domain-containing protein n=1 Tax=Clostridia TaxID=186801 RepID=UPI003F3AB9B7